LSCSSHGLFHQQYTNSELIGGRDKKKKKEKKKKKNKKKKTKKKQNKKNKKKKQKKKKKKGKKNKLYDSLLTLLNGGPFLWNVRTTMVSRPITSATGKDSHSQAMWIRSVPGD